MVNSSTPTVFSPVRTVITATTSAPTSASRTTAHHVSLRLMMWLVLQLRVTWLLLWLLLHHVMSPVDHLRVRRHATGYLMLLLRRHLNERLLSTCSGSYGRGSRRYKRMGHDPMQIHIGRHIANENVARQ